MPQFLIFRVLRSQWIAFFPSDFPDITSIKIPFVCKKAGWFWSYEARGKQGAQTYQGRDYPTIFMHEYVQKHAFTFFRVEQQKNSCLMEMNDVRSAVEELNMEKVSNKCTTCLLSITRVLHLLCKSSSEFLKIFLKDRFIDHIPTIFYFQSNMEKQNKCLNNDLTDANHRMEDLNAALSDAGRLLDNNHLKALML